MERDDQLQVLGVADVPRLVSPADEPDLRPAVIKPKRALLCLEELCNAKAPARRQSSSARLHSITLLSVHGVRHSQWCSRRRGYDAAAKDNVAWLRS